MGAEGSLVAALEVTSLKLLKASSLLVAEGAADPTTAVATMLDEAKAELAAARMELDALPEGGDPVVPGTYHRVAAGACKRAPRAPRLARPPVLARLLSRLARSASSSRVACRP